MHRIDPSIKIAHQEIGVSKHVPITHFNTPTILESHNGALFSVIKCMGVPFDTEKTDTINHDQHTWHRALSALDARFGVIGTLHRKKESTDLGGTFNNDFARKVNRAYMQQFQNSAMYRNDLYLVVIYKGLTTGKTGWLTQAFKKAQGHYIKAARRARRDADIAQLNQAVSQLLTSLSAFKPQLLGAADQNLGHSALLSYLSLFLNGGQALRLQSMASHAPIDSSFKKTKKAHAYYPQGNIAQYLSAKRIFFGDYIQFQGAQSEDRRFGALVTVKRYGPESASIMLDPLLQLDCEFISTNSFFIESKAQADKNIDRHTHKMQHADDPATSQIDALSVARDLLASDQMVMGYHHNTLMLLSDSIAHLEQQVAKSITCYMNAGIVAVREILGQEAAFWAQVPTNVKYIARSSLISSQNFVDFFPLHNYRTGFKDGNHLGGALTLIETPARTPLWFNLHAKGPKDNPAPGHTTIIGGNGSGKTVAMCFLDAQLNRYGGQSFLFDRNRGAEIYIRASGGYYCVLSPNHARDICFNPLQLADTPSNRAFCKIWLVQLVKKEEEGDVDEGVVDQLSHCVDYAYDQLAPEHRNLSHATKMLPIDFPRWTRLKRWLKGDNTRADGEYAYLFDHDKDALSMQTKMGFDMTHFLDHEPPNVLAAVTMYLFHRLEETLT